MAAGESPFLKIQNRLVWADQPEQAVITDHVGFLAVNGPEPEAIRYASELAAARRGRIRVRGSEALRRTASSQAAAF